LALVNLCHPHDSQRRTMLRLFAYS